MGHFYGWYPRNDDRMERLAGIKKFSRKYSWVIPWNLEEVLVNQHKVILVTDRSLLIRFASSNLYGMNGYDPHEVIGKPPSIFQGAGTSAQTKAMIRESVTHLKPFSTSILNYRKNGEPYQCFIEGFPVYNKKQQPAHYIAFEKLVA